MTRRKILDDSETSLEDSEMHQRQGEMSLIDESERKKERKIGKELKMCV